jgi:hypothetical protein
MEARVGRIGVLYKRHGEGSATPTSCAPAMAHSEVDEKRPSSENKDKLAGRQNID